MNAINNRRNHDFQILYFLVGSCHTADGAYALLCDLKEDREMALAQVESSRLRSQAMIEKSREIIENSKSKWEVLEARANLSEVLANEDVAIRNVNAAIAELKFINMCIDRIQPYRKFAHLQDSIAHEACQLEEWKHELIYRAENYLLTIGAIPTEHFTTMRQHPHFLTEIFPKIEGMKKTMSLPGGYAKIIESKVGFDVNKFVLECNVSAQHLLESQNKE